MIYRHEQGTFEICLFKAIYTVINEELSESRVEQYVSDKNVFESAISNSSQKWKDLEYINVELTDEQMKRYEEVRNLPESSIADCIKYIEEGIFPEGINHALRQIQLEQENIRLGQELSDREINEIIMGIQLSDIEIQILMLMMGGE